MERSVAGAAGEEVDIARDVEVAVPTESACWVVRLWWFGGILLLSCCCSLCRNVRKERWSSMLQLSVFGPESHASCTSLEHFDFACAWTLAFLKSTTCPLSDICAHVNELVSWLMTADLCSCVIVIRRFVVYPFSVLHSNSTRLNRPTICLRNNKLWLLHGHQD